VFDESLLQLNRFYNVETCHEHLLVFVHPFIINNIGTKGEINKSPSNIIDKIIILKLHDISSWVTIACLKVVGLV